DGTFDGSQIQTRYGTVQVQAVISGGKITDVVPLQLTDVGSLSGEIDQQAVPMLKSEVLSSQSSNVDTVGGATYTSEGYLSSLQAALDAANFKR
ncbi:FMN-binding protein, partial [Arthrobacter ramosus]